MLEAMQNARDRCIILEGRTTFRWKDFRKAHCILIKNLRNMLENGVLSHRFPVKAMAHRREKFLNASTIPPLSKGVVPHSASVYIQKDG